MKAPLEPVDEGISSTRLGDWYLIGAVLSQQQFALAASASTRLPILIPAAPYSTLPARLPRALREVLAALRIPDSMVFQEVREMSEAQLGKTVDRSVLGSLKDYRSMLEHLCRIDRIDLSNPLQVSLYLAETPSLVMEGVYPIEVTRTAFGLPSEPRARFKLHLAR